MELRNVATALASYCGEQGIRPDLDLDTIIDGLCWLALEHRGKLLLVPEGLQDHMRRRNELPQRGLNLLSAATYFGCAALVKDLLDQGHDPTKDNEVLFQSPMYLAAWTGQATMLELMQEHLPDFEDDERYNSRDFRSKIGPGSLHGAAVRGDMDMVQLALYPPSRTIPGLGVEDDEEDMGKETLVLGEKPGSIPVGSKLEGYICTGVIRTRSPAIYQRLRSFLDEDRMTNAQNWHLAIKAGAGDIVMVRHFLDTGVDPVCKDLIMLPPLVHAVRGWHNDVVDLLLERGADPSEGGMACFSNGTVLTAAAKAGSMVMLRKLLDAGAKIQSVRDAETLKYAVKLEHSAMVEMLLGMGAGDVKEREQVLEMAAVEGLESMVKILNSWGITLGK